MNLFWRNKRKIEPITIEPPVASRVEIELHKGASEEAAKKAKQVNEHVKELLVENGFTIKIAIAAGYGAPHNRKIKT